MNRRATVAIWAAVLGAAAPAATAQPVYKCQSQGKTVYSHEPCLGTQVVDTTPTQGLDKSSGTSRKGADVRKNEHNKAMAEAFKPLLNETPEQREARHRRFKLTASEQQECYALDARLPQQESAAKGGGQEAVDLLVMRKRYRDLRC